MRESIKAVLWLAIIVSVVVMGFVWTDDRPTPSIWQARVGSLIVALMALGAILKMHFRRDLAPDYLTSAVGTFFQRDGFCFGFRTSSRGGICLLNLYFQNAFERPCRGRVGLRPARGFFLGRAKFESIRFDIDCGPAAFGVARLQLPVPAKLQGKMQAFEVGASVAYPSGKGRRLRFRDGLLIRQNSNFGDAFLTALTVVGALGGVIVLSSPAKITLKLPESVAEEVPAEDRAEMTTLWVLDDPPMKGGKASTNDELS